MTTAEKYVTAAYLVVFLAVLVYVVLIAAKLVRLEREVAELAKVEPRLGRLTEGERRTVESVTAQIVNKLLHLPTVRLKQSAAAADGGATVDVVRYLFGLEEPEP